MSLGRKTGGRQKGTPNRRTVEASQILAELECDPIQGMAKIAMDEKTSPELRGRMFAELTQYAYPKRKAVELTTVWDGDISKLTEPQLAQLLAYIEAAQRSQVPLRPAEVEVLKWLAGPSAPTAEPVIDTPAEPPAEPQDGK
ncbi:MAG TPA: hypothetical protein VMH05_09090 [Bryobacteraceae bacterium]|nr:hypothetical protein [Bryobacteraceae bacterium]